MTTNTYNRSVNNKDAYTSAYTSQEVKCKSNFGRTLKILREKKGLSQKGLSQKTKISLSSIQRYERGHLPGGQHLLELSDFFEMTADSLLRGELASQQTDFSADGNQQFSQETGRGTRLTGEVGEEGDFGGSKLEKEPKHSEAESNKETSISELLVKTTKILESRTMYSRALSNNINTFYESVLMEDEIYKIRNEYQKMKSDVEKIRTALKNLEGENRELREKLGLPQNKWQGNIEWF